MAVAGAPWQLKCDKMEQRCGYLLKSGQWSDCTFMVGSETNQTAAHKLVLAMMSPVFEAMFYGGLSEGKDDPIVQIPDIKPAAFRVLLQYIYTGHAVIASFDVALDLWYGAKKYMLPGLANKCNAFIRSVLGPVTCCKTYELAFLFDNQALMEECIKIISTNTKEVLNDSSFVDLQLNTVITVFSLDQLNVDSELDLFNAVVRYAEAAKKRQEQINSPEDELTNQLSSLSVKSSQTSPAAEPDTKPPTEVVTCKSCGTPLADKKKLKKDEPTVRGALQKIRFLSLTAQQFAKGPALSGLLTEAESFAVFMNIHSKTRPVAMPTGFSDCRAPRNSSMDPCINAGCLEHIIKALKCGIPSQVEGSAISKQNAGKVAEKAIRVLEKIVLNKPIIRDAALNLGVVPAMLPYMHPDTPLTQLRTYVRAYCNMCFLLYCKEIKVNFELVSPALPQITELLALTDESVLSHACGALLNLTYGQNKNIEEIEGLELVEQTYFSSEGIERVQTTPGLTERLIALLGHSATQVKTDALKVIGNMLAGTDVQVDRCLEAGCLDHIINFLKCNESLLKEHAAWAAGNIVGKTDLYIQKVLDKQILEPLIKVLSEGDVKCQNHAAWAVSNMCKYGTAEQLDVLVSAGFLEPYCLLLTSPDNKLALASLQGHSNLLQKVVQTTRLAVLEKLRQIGVPQVLTTLLQHKEKKIEAAWAVSNMCIKGTAEQLDVLVSAGYLEPYCLLLTSADNKLVLKILEGLSYLLQKVVQTTRLAVLEKLRQIGVPQVLTTLLQHKEKKIRLKASGLMQTYFPDAVPANKAQGTRK